MRLNVLIASKETKKEFFNRKYGINNLTQACSEQEQDIQQVLKEHKQHHSNLENLINTFKSYDINPVVKARVRTDGYDAYTVKDFKKADVIVSFGGDGEVLDVARIINKKKLGNHKPLVWVERADLSSVAALSEDINIDYNEKVKKLVSKDYKVKKWARAHGVIKANNKIIAEDIALNELMCGDIYRVGMARYTIHLNEKKEYHMSGGILISTQVGLWGWLLNEIPPKNKEYDNPDFESRVLDYGVMAPSKRTKSGKLLRGTIKPGDKIIITSAMNYDGCVAFDGSKPHYKNSRCYDFNRGEILEVSISDEPLRVIRFK